MGVGPQLKDVIKILRKFIKTKDEILKEELYSTYKALRNRIVSLTRASKKFHFQQK